jgi:hypothetical protein
MASASLSSRRQLIELPVVTAFDLPFAGFAGQAIDAALFQFDIPLFGLPAMLIPPIAGEPVRAGAFANASLRGGLLDGCRMITLGLD